MFDAWRRRNLIESGKHTEEEVDEYPNEWKRCKNIEVIELGVCLESRMCIGIFYLVV